MCWEVASGTKFLVGTMCLERKVSAMRKHAKAVIDKFCMQN